MNMSEMVRDTDIVTMKYYALLKGVISNNFESP